MNDEPLSPSPAWVGDYEALRHAVGVVPTERDVLSVSGPDAVSYLQGQCSQDIEALEVGSSADALLLGPQGKLDALVRVTRLGDEALLVDVDAGYGPAVLARLLRFKLRVKADIALTDWRCVALRGPAASSVDPGDGAAEVTVAVELGAVRGLDLLGPEVRPPAGVPRCAAEAFEALRVETGLPVMGAELDDRTIAAEADLLERCVSFTKGCYTGQELVARLDARGNKVARRLRGLVFDPAGDVGPDAHPAPPPAPGAEVTVGEKVVGRLTSVAWSPALRSDVALGYLQRAVEPPCPVAVSVTARPGAVRRASARELPLVT